MFGGNALRKSTEKKLRSVFSESIRGGKPTKENQKFQWNEFVRKANGEGSSPMIEDRLEAMKWYINSTNIEKLGTGGSRVVFLLNSKSVLKVALHAFGIAQNKHEVQMSNEASPDVPLARVLKSDPSRLWIVSQLVRQIKNHSEFTTLVGYSLYEAAIIVKRLLAEDRDGRRPKMEDHDPGIWMIWSVVKAGDLSMTDIEHLEHWGVNSTGDVVLLDYGYTNSMHLTKLRL